MRVLRVLSLVLLGVFFVLAGCNHFIHAYAYERIVPAYFPAHHALVVVSGIAEVLGGIGVVIPVTRRAAGFGLIALLIAVFPANVEMALHPQRYADIASAPLLYARLPLQAVALAWVWWTCLRSSSR